MEQVTAILPMKGHSERVPGKNLRLMAGKPLYHWVVDTLLSSRNVLGVVVDTDSDLIADNVRASFPEVTIIDRPSHLLGDLVPMHEIIRHDVTVVSGDHFLQTHATNPLLRSSTVDEAVSAYFHSTDNDSLMSVTAVRSRFFDHLGHPVNHDPDELIRTQDLDPLLEENSNLYVFSRRVVENHGKRVGRSPLLFEIPREEAIDIDVEIDFRIAECILERTDR